MLQIQLKPEPKHANSGGSGAVGGQVRALGRRRSRYWVEMRGQAGIGNSEMA